MTTTSTGAHELALTIINDGAGYKDRCALARTAAENFDLGSAQRSVTQGWRDIAVRGASYYERQFGTVFSAVDILGAALEVAEYYERHHAETVSLEQAEAKAKA